MTLTQEQIDAERAVGFRDGVEWAKENLLGPLRAENERLKQLNADLYQYRRLGP